MRIDLDTAPIVYVVEQNSSFSPLVTAKLGKLGGDLVSGELVRLEALVLPTRNLDLGLIQDFEDFFAKRLTETVSVDRAVLNQAVQIRASYPFKTPDAKQLASSVMSGCDVFLTNDNQLKQFTGITVEVI